MSHDILSDQNTTLWINVALSAATVAVTCLGVIAAIAAFLGWFATRRMIRRHTRRPPLMLLMNISKVRYSRVSCEGVADELLQGHVRDTLSASLQKIAPMLRIPMKSAMHSNLKPATASELKPAGVPI